MGEKDCKTVCVIKIAKTKAIKEWEGTGINIIKHQSVFGHLTEFICDRRPAYC